MKPSYRRKTDKSVVGRKKRHLRIRKTIKGTVERPRLVVFRSLSHIYAQVVDDAKGVTLVEASSLKGEKSGSLKGKSGKDVAKYVGAEVAKRALEKSLKNVVFDRNGYAYHGRVQALAEAAREAGLNF